LRGFLPLNPLNEGDTYIMESEKETLLGQKRIPPHIPLKEGDTYHMGS
jgi:hypothetical protein